jgi:hypothetical protein
VIGLYLWGRKKATWLQPLLRIFGAEMTIFTQMLRELVDLCAQDVRHLFLHNGSHEFPGGADQKSVTGGMNMIRRAIDAAAR